MNKPANAPRWTPPWRRAAARAQDDPADLGTCYGLELSLSAEPAPAKGTPQPARRVGWMQRLAFRRRPAI